MHLGFKTKHYELVQRAWISEANQEYNIWIDHKNKIYFSQAQFRGDATFGKDHHFNCPSIAFVDGKWGSKYCKTSIKDWADLIEQKQVVNEEIIFGAPEKIQNLQEKSVLILAGGPSANSVNWKNLKYDQIWSCNHFYKNKKIVDQKLDLITLTSGLGNILEDENLLDYIKIYNPTVCFEVEQGLRDVERQNYRKVSKFCEFYKNTTYFQTRYRGQPGLGLRMVIYAALAGFRDVYFVGIDGRSQEEINGSLLHAFDGNKNIPNWYKKFGDDFQDRQFIIFWDYLMELKKQYGFNVFNLGEKEQYNVLGKLFSDSHPLPKNIKELL
tara:strand:+ start:1884 stop:2861 length:978 start_codon:yes stop_codon:yes gene_type:complete